jgi:hypothetical protein
MNEKTRLGIAVALASLTLACASKILVPPKVDLKAFEVIGVIEFDCPSGGELCPFATQRFIDVSREDQGMVRILNLGSQADVLASIGEDGLDQEAFQALGQKHSVSTIVTGKLVVSSAKPDVAIDPAVGYAGVGAQVKGELSVQMIEVATGASVWSRSANASRQLGGGGVLQGEVVINIQDPDNAYSQLIDDLAYAVAQDFQATWERRK